jgi:hypothetical protein
VGKGGMNKMKNKIISAVLVLAMAMGVASCSKTDGKSNRSNGDRDRDRDTEDVAPESDDGYFIIEDKKDGPTLEGLTDKGKKQETLVIPAGVLIGCTLKDSIVKHVSFESDDDIDLDYLLSGIDTLETVELPANLTVLPPIDCCHNLKEITIPKGVTEIPFNTFFADDALVTVTIEGDVTVIGDNAFMQCYALENINIPDSVTEIGPQAFSKCTSLGTVTLPKGLKVIGRNAFSNNDGGIDTVIVPEEMELEDWVKHSFDQGKAEYTVIVVEGSWADIHFDEVFDGHVIKKYA